MSDRDDFTHSIVHFWKELGLVNGMDDQRVEEVPEERPAKRMRVGKPAGWADFKDEIYQLYAVKNYSIEELMDAMQKKGLQASRRTYMKRITEWGFQKKIRRSEKEAMLAIERRRSAIGKRTNFRIRGQTVTAAKLKRAAAANEEEELEAGSPIQADTPSCISYDTPAPSSTHEDEYDADDSGPSHTPLQHTASWAEDPTERFWRTRSAMGSIASAPVRRVEEPVLVDDIPTYGLTKIEEVPRACPFMYHESGDLKWFDVISSDEDSDSGSEAGDSEGGNSEITVRKYMTSTMPSVMYEHRRNTVELKLEGGVRAMIKDDPDRPAPSEPVGDYCLPEDEEDVNEHLKLFRNAISSHGDDEARNQHFSDVLGILKSKYDREQATLKLMGTVFENDELATEEQVRDKLEALLDYRHRHHGFEAQTTLDACLAGIILMLDATRIDMEQQTWNQEHVRGRLNRVRQFFNRIFAVFFTDETTQELMGDEEGKDVTGPQPATIEGRAKANRMMENIATKAVESNTVLHALELLPRYHKQWAGWHIQDQIAEKPHLLFTRTTGVPSGFRAGGSPFGMPPPPSSSFFGMPTTGGAFV